MNRKSVPYLAVLPSMAVITLFTFHPIFMIFFNNFHNYILTRPKDYGFNGLGSCVKLFEDPIFFKAFKNTVMWIIWSAALQAGSGLMVAILMDTDSKGRKLYRMVVFSPWTFGGMIVALVFSYMFTGQTGAINDILTRAGIIEDRIPWSAIGARVVGVLIFTITWRGIPFFAVSFLVTLQSISHDYYEATDVDGAGAMYQFLHITMPLIQNTMILTTMLRVIWTFNVVDIIAGMMAGRPNNATMTLSTYLMSKFNEGMDVGYSSCMVAVMALILATSAIGYSLVRGFGKEGDL